MRSLPVWSLLMLSVTAGKAVAADTLSGWTLKADDVVFMYPATETTPSATVLTTGPTSAPVVDVSAYQAYGATVLAWGGASTLKAVQQLHDLGMHATGTAWCLTPGAKELHDNVDLADATCRDIEGKSIIVPWQLAVYKGTPCWFGCTNHPAFRGWLAAKVALAMSGGADGLHVDDYMGSAHPALNYGGCFCDYCMADFRQWLIDHSNPQLLAEANVQSFDKFDYRDLVRQYARTREDYLKIQSTIPLHKEFVDCQLQLAVEHVRQLGQTAAEIVNHPITLSANTGLPGSPNLAITPYLSYMVGEVHQNAAKGTTDLIGPVAAYRMAEAIGKPIAATAAGGDWAFVKEHKAENLVKVWIALSYAGGQRLMTPNRVWCFSKEKGSDFYNGPREAYAPMYQFVRHNSQLFVGLKAAGPMAIPDNLPKDFSTSDGRAAFMKALSQGNPKPPVIAEHVWGFPRAGADLSVVHLVNLDYDPAKEAVATKHDLAVKVPADWFGKTFKEATVYRPDAEPVKLTIAQSGGEITVTVPELTHWAIVRLK